MQVSELVARTSVPLATVKYYLREGLLSPGRKVSARSAEYDERHVRRLELLRILRDVGQIPVGRLRSLVDAVEDTRLSVHDMFARATDAIAPTPPEPGPRHDEARAQADGVLDRVGWSEVRPGATDRKNLTGVLEVLLRRGPVPDAVLDYYAAAADRMARDELASLDPGRERELLLEDMVVGTVAYGELFSVLRRLAEEHHSAGRFRDRT